MSKMKKVKLSDQSIRLAEFVDLTGYSVNAFAKECGIPSTRTMTQILQAGISPSGKVLDKIVKRFPQLNHDWVVLGYGEMIVKGIQDQPASAASIGKSKAASFESITEKQINSDFQLNELTNRIDKALVLQAQSTQLIQNQIMQMANVLDGKLIEWDKSAKLRIGKFDSLCKQIPEHVETSFLQAANETKEEWVDLFDVTTKAFLKYVTDLDVERKEIIANESANLSAKIIEALNKNTTSAIDVITDKLNSNPNT